MSSLLTLSPGGPPAAELAVRVDRQAERTVLALSGELDMATTPPLEAELRRAGTRGGELAVDLRGLSFIDASGLGALLRAQARARADGRRFAVLSSSPPVQRLLTLTGTEAQLAALDPR